MAEKQVKDYDKFNLRFPDGMRDAIAERAKANGRSMNSEIVQILQDALAMPSAASADIVRQATEHLDLPEPSDDEKIWMRRLQRPENSPELQALVQLIFGVIKSAKSLDNNEVDQIGKNEKTTE